MLAVHVRTSLLMSLHRFLSYSFLSFLPRFLPPAYMYMLASFLSSFSSLIKNMYMYACIHVHRTSLPPPQLSDGLGADNVRALKNLCADVIPKPKLETIDSGLDVFNALIEKSEWCLYSEPGCKGSRDYA